MKITRLEIRKLYGYMDKTIDFNDNINLLVGINGSGKTSVLNVINWMLLPSFPNLCVTLFNKIVLNLTHNKEKFQIVAIQNKKEVNIKVKNISKNYTYYKVQADLKVNPREIINNNDLKDKVMSDYYGLGPDKKEEEAWNFIFNTLPNPIVIGLDRNLYTEESNKLELIEDRTSIIRHRKQRPSNLGTPLIKVKKLSSLQYAHYKNIIFDLNKRLNDKIMLSSFEETLTQKNLEDTLASPKLTLDQVQNLEIKVKEYFRENILEKKRPSVQKQQRQEKSLQKIEDYFSNLKEILKNSKSQKKTEVNLLYLINVNQFRKIRGLIKEFKTFEIQSKKAFETLKQYLSAINIFLKDSSKELYFDSKSSKIKFRIFDNKLKSIEENRDIDTLSSGEKQILILFTYIKFNHKLGRLFIIDEPELSLHPKWQENFLDGLKLIMPDNIQLIFATHSPSIVGENEKYCKILLPY